MKEKTLATILGAVVILSFAVIFLADDATGLGEIIDPIEFVFMAVLGYTYNNVSKGEKIL